MKKIYLLLFLPLFLVSCNNEPTFKKLSGTQWSFDISFGNILKYDYSFQLNSDNSLKSITSNLPQESLKDTYWTIENDSLILQFKVMKEEYYPNSSETFYNEKNFESFDLHGEINKKLYSGYCNFYLEYDGDQLSKTKIDINGKRVN